jgi:hypothetical protein
MAMRHNLAMADALAANRDTSPQLYARVGGLLYLLIIVAGVAGELFVRGSMVVSRDAAATAHNIATSPLLWRAGIAGDLVMHLCDPVVMLVFYVLLRPVNRNLALLALLFNVIQSAMLVANKLNLLLPLFFLSNAEHLKAFSPQQLQALSYVAVQTHEYGFNVGLLFFGVTAIIYGYLIVQSGYFPKLLGILMSLAGVCYMTNSFALLLSPAFESKLVPFILLPCFIGELSMALWLTLKGVNVDKFHERSRRAMASAPLSLSPR